MVWFILVYFLSIFVDLFRYLKFLNFFVFLAPKFQVMIEDGGTINCSGKFHGIKINMGEYLLDSPMIAIQMGGVDVVVWVQWLQSLGTITLNFQDIFMRFFSEGKEIELRGIQGNPSKVLSCNRMTKLLKNEPHGVLAQLCSLDVQTSRPSILVVLQNVINNILRYLKILRRLFHLLHIMTMLFI
jgi:hypothetical protein